MALWPWIDAIEVSGHGSAETLSRTAERGGRDLRRLIVVTAPVETMLRDAVDASRKLADCASKPAVEVAYIRMEALLALNDLIAWLRRAKPSEWAEVAGIGW